MITAVLDANVLASSFVRSNPAAAPVLLLDAWRARSYTLVVSEHILTELRHTFEDRYFRRRLTP
ncbi:MAG: PIN domain-containing protein [Chloroflexi bacterium]|nr:PIN domain-containing protein [Chloroflexota bacterium]